ncbi:hypothetical protein SLEP1_g31516 [Rubroshorea leprosula]|uniref:Uncharacterized protein n=1 Tax=Rubroshorea leprosula TaxID=152421 RepID=A0AAV5K8L0_9ROSI|nr:hypothetical protein SLEP1_g31516 [Rubroshorea leprosula]
MPCSAPHRPAAPALWVISGHIFLTRELPAACRRLLPQPSSVLLANFWVLANFGSAVTVHGSRSFCQLVRELSARFYASEDVKSRTGKPREVMS